MSIIAIRTTDHMTKLQCDVNGTAVCSQSSDLLFNEAISGLNYASFDLDTTTYTVDGKPTRQLSKHKDFGIIFTSTLNCMDRTL